MNTNIDIDKIGKKSPFKVPDGYLDSLQREIVARNTATPSFDKDLSVEDRKRPTLLGRLPAAMRPVHIAAACIVALVAVCWSLFAVRTAQDTVTMDDITDCFAQLSEQDQETYLELYNDDIILTQIDL